MAQWMNLHWVNLHQNSNFVNSTQLLLLCEKSEAIILGFTVGLHSDRPAVRQNTGRSENLLKFLYEWHC